MWWLADPQDLHRVADRLSTVYIERCHLDRDENAVIVNRERTIRLPVAMASSSATPNARIRDRLWALLSDRINDGQAVMVEPACNEQRWAVPTAGRDRWYPVNLDGLILAARPRR